MTLLAEPGGRSAAEYLGNHSTTLLFTAKPPPLAGVVLLYVGHPSHPMASHGIQPLPPSTGHSAPSGGVARMAHRRGHLAVFPAWHLWKSLPSCPLECLTSHLPTQGTKVLTQLSSAGAFLAINVFSMEEPLSGVHWKYPPPEQLQSWPGLWGVTCLGKHSHTLPNPEPSNPLSCK